jgi:hypothetical protein
MLLMSSPLLSGTYLQVADDGGILRIGDISAPAKSLEIALVEF